MISVDRSRRAGSKNANDTFDLRRIFSATFGFQTSNFFLKLASHLCFSHLENQSTSKNSQSVLRV
jgi:hypothetical protein